MAFVQKGTKAKSRDTTQIFSKPTKEMFKTTRLLLLLLAVHFLTPSVYAGNKFDHIRPTKNIIVMIADGTSISAVSLGRWYQRVQNPDKIHLNLDPYLSGTILTYCSDAPIGDSAPTTSSYMNGVPSMAGFVGTYPQSTDHDLIPLEPEMAYRPVVSAFEAARLGLGKRVGLVATSEFCHATPADCMSHYYRRNSYEYLIPQLAQNGVEVLYAGGTALVNPEIESYLKKDGIKLYRDDMSALNAPEDKVWGLYGARDVTYDLDRDPAKVPSLAQLAKAAINHLNQNNPNGFCLMIEGSKIDWAAHSNDAVAVATEMLAFDEAFAVALDFAQKDGNTTIIVTADHGNSGLSIGRRSLGGKYAETSYRDLFGALTNIKKTSWGLKNILLETPEDQVAQVFEKESTITPTDTQVEILKVLRHIGLQKKAKETATDPETLLSEKAYLELQANPYPNTLEGYIAALYNQHMHIGFTTFGHTGEEVFLASYATTPDQRLYGMNTNIDLHNYIRAIIGLKDNMVDLSHKYFAPHTEVFKGYKYTLTGDKGTDKVLTVKNGKKTLVVPALRNVAYLNGVEHRLPLTTVYMDKTDQLYIPAELVKLIK